MSSRHLHVRAGAVASAVACVVLGLTACGEAVHGQPAATEDAAVDDSVVHRPAAGGTELVVEPGPPTETLVVDPLPTGARVRNVDFVGLSGSMTPNGTLYGDPTLPDTLDGPVLLVGASMGSAFIAGPRDYSQAYEIDINGFFTQVVPAGGRTWVIVLLGSDYKGIVVGRGLSESVVVEAARHVDFEAGPATIEPAGVPDGLAPLVATGPSDGPWSRAGEQAELELDGVTVRVTVVRADARLAAMWGFWADDPDGTLVRGQPGSAGEMPGNVYDYNSYGEVWPENGNVIAVQGSGEPGPHIVEAVRQVVESLRVGDPEAQAVMEDAVLAEISVEDAGCMPGAVLVSARDDEVRWVYGIGPDPTAGGLGQCSAVINAGDGAMSGSGSGPQEPLPEVGKIIPGGVNGMGARAPEHGGVIIGGVAPPGTLRVVARRSDGATVDGVLADEGMRPGERVFGAFFAGDLSIMGPFLVTAYDATGAILDEIPIS